MVVRSNRAAIRCLVVTVLACMMFADCGPHPMRPGRTSASAAMGAQPDPAHGPMRPAVRLRQSVSSDAIAVSVDRVLGQPPWHAAVAIQDLATGQTLVRDAGGHGFAAASIAKLDILAALLLRRQDAGSVRLSAAQQALVVPMIEASDNGCANLFFRQVGGAFGLSLANRRFGLTGTRVHEPRWGLSTTTASDQLRLLQQIFTTRSALTASSRAYIQRLMGQVDADQNWGVSAAADGPFALKDGWLPRPDGTWTVNSIGAVHYHGHLLLIGPTRGCGSAPAGWNSKGRWKQAGHCAIELVSSG